MTQESLQSYKVYSRKPKRTEWGFQKAVAILNTQKCPFQLYRTIVVQAWINNVGPTWYDEMIKISRIFSENGRTHLIVTICVGGWSLR